VLRVRDTMVLVPEIRGKSRSAIAERIRVGQATLLVLTASICPFKQEMQRSRGQWHDD
jgi:hypothetical protein